MRGFMELYRRRKRGELNMRFHRQHVENRIAWGPFLAIQNLNVEAQGTFLWGRSFGLPQYTSGRKRPRSRS